MTELTCGIVRDLLPSVADGIAGPETQASVARHLETCADCKRRFADMTAAPVAEAAGEAPEIDFLKKAKKKHRRAVVAAALVVCLLAGATGGTLYYLRTFVWGRAVPASALEYRVYTQTGTGTGTEAGRLRETLIVEGKPLDSALGITKTAETFEDGTVAFTVELARKTGKSDLRFLFSRELTDDLKRVTLNGETVWENGVEISEETRRLFAAAHPYVGDMTANARSAEALGVSKTLGNFTNELQTSEEPYVWTIRLESPQGPDALIYHMANMNKFAAGLIATIGNLDTVIFRWTTEDGKEHVFQLDEKTADERFGGSVREAAKTLSGLQTLLFDSAFQGVRVQITEADGDEEVFFVGDGALPDPNGRSTLSDEK